MSDLELAESVLNIKFDHSDSDSQTVGGFLAKLLTDLLHQGEGFDSKRPWGNGGWQTDLEDAIEDAGYMNAEELTIEAVRVLLNRDKSMAQILASDIAESQRLETGTDLVHYLIEQGWSKNLYV